MKRSFPSFPHCRLVLAGAACVAVLSGTAIAQQATAQIAGTVQDQSGAVVAGATLTLKNSNNGSQRSTTAGKDGNYQFASIPIGSYEVTVEKPGFRKYERKGITLDINQNAKLDVVLDVGAANQVVEVQGNVTQVDTTSAVLGKVETTQRIEQLPLAARDTMQLGLLQAGTFAPDQEDGSGNAFSVSGQRSESQTFLIDGADNNDFLGNNMVVNPNPDAVAEFKIITNNYEAEYGRTSGGIVNQVVKSGTNSIHGSAFDFFRNTALDASDYFLQEAPVFRYNVFGGTIGLPIKKDKAFFFASYQGSRRAEGQIAPAMQVLDSAERGGDFSELYTGQIDPATGFDTGQLYDPTTGNPYTCGGIACNNLPVDPVIKNYINKYLPLPNLPNNEFVSAPVASLRDDQFIFRFDYNLSPKDTLSAFYIFDDQPQTFPFQVVNGASSGGDVPNGSGFSNADRFQTGSISWTRTVSPTMLNELRFATNRIASLDATPTDKTTPSELGLTTVTPDDPAGAAPPLMAVSGAFSLGPSPQGPTKLHRTTFQYQDTFSWNHGHHALKFGGDLRWIENNFDYDFYNNGSFFFGDFGAFTASTAADNISYGSTLADFVGGFFDNYYQFSNARYSIRTHSWDFFGQDSWKLGKNLTLNYGLRYEYNSPQRDPHNEIIGWYPGQQSTVFPGAPTGFLYPGDPGTPNRSLVYPDRNNFAPRFGFAWDMLGNAKLVMRGGFGIFYDIEDGALNLQFGGQPPFGYVANNYPSYLGQTPSAAAGNSFVADPFTPFGYPNPYPFAASGNIGKFFSPALPYAYVVDPHFRTPYAENFNYGFQYQLARATMVEAVYVGSLSRKAISSTETNFPVLNGPNGLLAQLAAAGGDASQLNPECARPLAFCDANGNPTGAQQIYTNVSGGSSSSNELQLTVDQRLNHGVEFRIAYTLSKTIDVSSGFRARSSTYTIPTNPAFDRGLADFDATHRLVLSPIWQLPGLSHGNAFLRKFTDGWAVSTIASFQSGNPFTIYSNSNSSESDNYLDRPDVTGPIKIFHNPRQMQTLSGSCGGGTLGHYYFDPTNLDCANVPLFSHGGMGRNVLRGPGINNWDISLLKDFRFSESKSLEFQANFFNAFNHVQFYGPSSTEGASGGSQLFGQVTSDTSPSTSTYYRGPRIVQFALKFYY
jgi:hypothetical protein